jgi:hypothetical protein
MEPQRIVLPDPEVERKSPFASLQTQCPPNLVTAAYAQLATAMFTIATMEQYQGCGRMYILQPGKHKYCTKNCAPHQPLTQEERQSKR